MTFISSGTVEMHLKEHGIVWTLKNHGRNRVAPSLTVADYVRIGEFFAHAHHPKRGDFAYWDEITHPIKHS